MLTGAHRMSLTEQWTRLSWIVVGHPEALVLLVCLMILLPLLVYYYLKLRGW